MIYRTVFCTLKHHNPTFEKKYDFLELFCLLIIESISKKLKITKVSIHAATPGSFSVPNYNFVSTYDNECYLKPLRIKKLVWVLYNIFYFV